MCNWFQNKSPTHTFAVDWDTWHGNLAAPCYFNGASPTGSARWGYCLQRHLACEGLYEGSLLPAVATQPPGQFALRSMATHGDASTLTYNRVQLTALDGTPWRTDISPALDGGSFEHFKTSVRPPSVYLLAPSGARRHSPTVVSAPCGAQLRLFTVFEPPLSADKNRQCVIVALASHNISTIVHGTSKFRFTWRESWCNCAKNALHADRGRVISLPRERELLDTFGVRIWQWIYVAFIWHPGFDSMIATISWRQMHKTIIFCLNF